MSNIEQLSIDTIRIISAEAIQKANSGHPGLPLGAAPVAYTLWAKEMKHNPANPDWVDRDRFVLSAGHGSMLIYSLLHLFGYGLTMEDLKNFRQKGSLTPGHPEYGHTKGVEMTTGPLGQGVSSAVGMAMAESYLASRFNKDDMKIVDHYTYAIVGDGCLMEGISYEACSLAGTLGLGKLIVLYDSNNISIEGDTDIAFTEDVGKRFEAQGWQVLKVEDGNDLASLLGAIREGKSETNKPTLIEVKTLIGFGSPKQGMASAHGEPLGEENIKITKKNLGFDPENSFHVPEEVYAHMDDIKKEGLKKEKDWNKLFEAYKVKYPNDAKEWEAWHDKKIPVDLIDNEEFWTFDKAMATRQSSGEVINRLSKLIPNLIGGSADLSPSTKTIMTDRGHFTPKDHSGSNLHFGVREHAMAAISNGLALHGGLRPYCSTFFVFSDYMKASMRLAALMQLPVTYVLTHDSIGVGEDGPTHQPIEQLAALRSLPDFTVFRPADSKETAAAWYYAVTNNKKPTAMVLTRQALPLYDESGKEALKGGYVLLDSDGSPDIILMATGSEVELIYTAAKELQKEDIKVRVVSIPSFELFEEQSEAYKEQILPKSVTKRLAVEAGSSFGWHKYVGLEGKVIAMDTFGASGPAKELFKMFGFTTENVIEQAKTLLK